MAQTASLGITMANFRFPLFLFPTAFAFVTSETVLDNPTIYNISPTVTVYQSEVAVEVKNVTTGAMLRFNRAVATGERLVIDIANTRVTLETKTETGWKFKENAMHYLVIASDLTEFYIVPGRNEFDLEQLGVESDPIMSISMNIPIMGV